MKGPAEIHSANATHASIEPMSAPTARRLTTMAQGPYGEEVRNIRAEARPERRPQNSRHLTKYTPRLAILEVEDQAESSRPKRQPIFFEYFASNNHEK
jgi:hypothetical protein